MKVGVVCAACAGCGRIGVDELPVPTGDQLAPGDAGHAGTSASVGGHAGVPTGTSGAEPGGAGPGGAPAAGAAGVGVGGSAGLGPAGGDAGAVPNGGSAGDSAIGAGGAPGGQGGQSAAGAGQGGSGGAGVPYCNALPPLDGAPTIDGAIEAGLELERVDPVGWRGTGSVPDGYAMSYAAAWRPDGLYFFLRVQDPDRNPAESADPVWMGDAVEIYVDSDGVYPAAMEWDDPGARQFTVGAPVDDTTPSTRAEHYVALATGVTWDTGQFIAVPTPEGYDVEALIVAEDLGLSSWQLAVGGTVGFDLGHDVSVPPGETGTSGNRDSQYFLRVAQGSTPIFPFLNESAFCTATLQ